MKVVLLADVKNLGRRGEIVEVSNGFGRNFLFPKKMAVLATREIIASVEKNTMASKERESRQNRKLRDLIVRIKGKTLEFRLPADEKGHLYAGLKESEIFAKIGKEQDTSVLKGAKLVAYEPIKAAGEHKVRLRTDDDEAEINILIRPVKSSARADGRESGI